MQHRLHEMDHRLIRRFTPRAIYFLACFLFVTAPEVNKDHQHTRFKNVWIDSECFGEGLFCFFVISRSAKALEHAVHVTSAKPVVRQCEVWVELDGTLEMLDRRIAIVRRQSAKYETGK